MAVGRRNLSSSLSVSLSLSAPAPPLDQLPPPPLVGVDLSDILVKKTRKALGDLYVRRGSVRGTVTVARSAAVSTSSYTCLQDVFARKKMLASQAVTKEDRPQQKVRPVIESDSEADDAVAHEPGAKMVLDALAPAKFQTSTDADADAGDNTDADADAADE